MVSRLDSRAAPAGEYRIIDRSNQRRKMMFQAQDYDKIIYERHILKLKKMRSDGCLTSIIYSLAGSSSPATNHELARNPGEHKGCNVRVSKS
jgi:hypothetical protein